METWPPNRENPGTVGRKPTEGDAKKLDLEMKGKNPSWGLSRILGELRKVGHNIGRTTINRNYS